MATAAPLSASAVTMLVSRRVKPGHEAAFAQAAEDMIAAAQQFAGHLGGQTVHPAADDEADGAAGNLYHSVFAFDTPEHLQAWQTSPERTRCLQAMPPHTLSSSTLREVSGLGHWFSSALAAAHKPPPRWKVALATWLVAPQLTRLLKPFLYPLVRDNT